MVSGKYQYKEKPLNVKEDSGLSGQMRRLILVLPECTSNLVGNAVPWLKCFVQEKFLHLQN